MQKKNVIDLKTGLNKISVTYEDFGYISGIFPVARLPVDSYIKNASFKIQTPFGATGGSALANNDQAIPILYNFSLGYVGDSNYFIHSTATDEENQTDANIVGANTGSYFDAPVSFDTPLELNLRVDVSTRVWQTSNDMNTPRGAPGGCGTQTAALTFGGRNGTGVTYQATTEEYDGTSWTASNDMSVVRNTLGSAGTQIAALAFGGYPTYLATTEEYDGTSWTAANDMSVARRLLGGCGIQTAALSFGGWNGSCLATTEEYNGTSWTISDDMIVARRSIGGTGTQSAALGFGGRIDDADSAVTEEYDGTSWVVANNLNVARRGAASAGTQSAALSFGGQNGTDFASTEEYDSTSWTLSNNLNVARHYLAGAGVQTSALTFGGNNDGGIIDLVITEEYNAADFGALTKFGSMVLNITVY